MVNVLLVTSAVGVLIPLLNALVTHVDASPALKAGVAVLLAALGSVATWATSVTGNVSIKDLVVVALGGLVVAGGARNAVLKGVIEKVVTDTVPGGIGKPAA